MGTHPILFGPGFAITFSVIHRVKVFLYFPYFNIGKLGTFTYLCFVHLWRGHEQ